MVKKNKKDISPKIKASLENKEVSSYAYQISKIRIDNNLTQMELANILGVSDKTVSSWENGNTTPDSETIKKICSEFGISLSAFVLQKASFKDYIKYFLKCFVKCLDFVWKNILKFIIAILFILLLIYFLNNYNAINMYSLNYDTDDDISLSSGYFIQNKVQNILIINDITITKLDYEIETIDLDLYTLVNGDKVVIYESNNLNDILIDELIEYPVVLKKDIIKSIKKNLHLEINIIDTDNEIHNYEVLIMFKDYFSNNKLIYKDFKSELNNYNTSTYTNQFIANQNYNNNYYSLNNYQEDSKEVENETSTEEKLENIGYTYNEETSTYTKTDGIKNIEYDDSYKTLTIRYYVNDYKFVTNYYIYNNLISFIENNNNITSTQLNYYVDTKSYECIIGNCENYKSEIDYILKEYELITTTLGN
mgnify:CR=1 FL=1